MASFLPPPCSLMRAKQVDSDKLTSLIFAYGYRIYDCQTKVGSLGCHKKQASITGCSLRACGAQGAGVGGRVWGRIIHSSSVHVEHA